MCSSTKPRILVDANEEDVALAENPIGMSLLPVGTRDVVPIRREEVIGGDGHGFEHGSIHLINLSASADRYRLLLEEPGKDDGPIVSHDDGRALEEASNTASEGDTEEEGEVSLHDVEYPGRWD